MPWPTLPTWADLAVAAGTGLLAAATFKVVKRTEEVGKQTERLATETVAARRARATPYHRSRHGWGTPTL